MEVKKLRNEIKSQEIEYEDRLQQEDALIKELENKYLKLTSGFEGVNEVFSLVPQFLNGEV